MSKRILRAIGDIDDRYIEEAERYTRSSAIRKRALTITGIAAAAAVIVGGTVLLNSRPGQNQPPISESTSSCEEVWIIPSWDEMSMVERFSEVEFGGERYNGSAFSGFERGEYLGEAELTGYDVYEEKSYTANAEVYSNVGISTQCAVVVVFETGEEYVYRNTWYKPSTLGEFIRDLNLRENLEITSAYVQDNRADGWSNTHYTGVSTDKIMEILFADESIPNVQNFDQMVFEFGSSKIDFAVDIRKIGAQNISIALTEEGWLTTNILDTGKAFYVGTEKIDEVMRYLETCDGETHSYTYQIEESEPYEGDEAVSVAASSAYQPE
ncbi:MAG: hypothetical protein ACI4KM_02160 [Oscillospiraceae bacterium]